MDSETTQTTAPPSGRELDALVAERVMGLTIVHRNWPCGYGPDCGYYEAALSDDDTASWYKERGPVCASFDGGWPPDAAGFANVEPVPQYSTNIADAWAAFKRALERHGHAEIVADMEDYGREPGDIVTVVIGFDEACVTVTGHAPEAICRATLAAEEALSHDQGAAPDA